MGHYEPPQIVGTVYCLILVFASPPQYLLMESSETTLCCDEKRIAATDIGVERSTGQGVCSMFGASQSVASMMRILSEENCSFIIRDS